jgi:putative hydrolase of the HAD superfamily
MIKAAIFDLGSVLAASEWSLVYKKIANKIKIPKGKIKKIIDSLFSKWCKGQLDEKGFWDEFKIQTGMELPNSFTKDFWFKTYKKWSRDIKGTWKILEELRSRRIRLALLSNTIKPHVLANKKIGRFKKLRDIGFEAFIYSYEVGCEKPCPRMYKDMLKRLDLAAQNCVFIDDKIKNIEGAARLGMKGILFRTPGQLKKELIKLSIL